MHFYLLKNFKLGFNSQKGDGPSPATRRTFMGNLALNHS